MAQQSEERAVKLKIKKGAMVQVIAGDDKGKKGTVIEVKPQALKIKVQGVRVQTRHNKKEGLQKIEGYIDYSNVKMVEAPKTSEKKKAKATSKK